MKQKPSQHKLGDFLEGKGFYIVLFLCVAAIGISGYFLFSGLFAQPEGFGGENRPPPPTPGTPRRTAPTRRQPLPLATSGRWRAA